MGKRLGRGSSKDICVTALHLWVNYDLISPTHPVVSRGFSVCTRSTLPNRDERCIIILRSSDTGLNYFVLYICYENTNCMRYKSFEPLDLSTASCKIQTIISGPSFIDNTCTEYLTGSLRMN